jgi:ABC-type spermidine/putrescine transport system permease subunit II
MNNPPLKPSERLLRVVAGTTVGVVVLLVFSPVLLTLVLSVSDDRAIAFPPRTWGLDRYARLVESPQWLEPLWLSIRLAAVSAVATVVVGVMALMAIHRSALSLRRVLEQVSAISLAIPSSAYAVAMYAVFAQYRLLGTFHGLVIANVVLALPFVVLVGGTSLRGTSEDVELVAFTLGARRWRVWLGVTLRLLAPAFLAAFVMAFQQAFEESVFINFLGGPGLRTLPKAIFDSVQFGSDPVITAIASVIILVSALVIAVPLARSRGKSL